MGSPSSSRRGIQGEKDQSLEITAVGALACARALASRHRAKGQMTNADWRILAAKAAQASPTAPRPSRSSSAFPTASRPTSCATWPKAWCSARIASAKYFTGDRRPKAELATVDHRARRQGAPRQGASECASTSGKAWPRRSPRPAIWSTSRPTSSTPRVSPAKRSAWPKRRASSARCSTSKEIEKRGMKLLLAVGQGSVNEPRFVHISLHAQARPRRSSSSSARGSPSTPAASASSPPPAWAR